MKKIFLAVAMLTIVFYAQAQNLVDNGDFENLTQFSTSAGDPKEVGIWHFRSMDLPGSKAVISKDKDRGNVAVIVRVPAEGAKLSWYNPFFAQVIDKEVDKGIYRLTFMAKANGAEPSLKVYLRNAEDEISFFMLKDREKTGGSSAAQQIALTGKWVKYTVEFDFSKSVNTVWDDKKITPTTDKALSRFFLAFNPNTDYTTVFLDDVKLEKVK